MQLVRNSLLFCVLLLLFACKKKKSEDTVEDQIVQQPTIAIKGADISFLPVIRQSSLVLYNRQNKQEDMLNTLLNNGVNTFRIRLWYQPISSASSFYEVKALAQEIKSKGGKVLLTVHYSDSWADPGKQTKPSAWTNLSIGQLNDSVFEYTKRVVQEIQADYIQVGNEINFGLLWPEGSISNTEQMKMLVKTGVRAVRLFSKAKIILHHAGHTNALTFCETFKDVDYDIIGISYYPQWHGRDLAGFETNLKKISEQSNKDVLIAEMAYPFTLGWSDYTNNVLGLSSQILPEYPASEQGQKDFLLKMKSIVKACPRGIGFCYWGGEWVAYNGPTASNGSSWENQALWDFQFKAVPAIEAFKDE
jgi:arabinogalactan endo-1,4-beta-galactosidase